MSHTKGEWHSDKKKLEAVTTYLLLGKAPLVSAMIGVPVGTIRRWKTEPWWQEMVDQIQMDNDQELDAKLEKRLNKVLDLVEDRLENGDFMFNPKEGIFVRRPVSLKDGWKVGKEMVDVRMVLRKQKPEQVNQEAVGDILKGLAREFADMARKKVKETVNHDNEDEASGSETGGLVNGSELSEGVRPISGEGKPDSEEVQTEQSSTPSREGRTGP